MTRTDIDYLLDKYRIRELVRSVSANYVDAAEMLFYGETRDEDTYRYASRKFDSVKRRPFTEMSSTIRQYIAVLKGEEVPDFAIKSKDELEECLDYLWDYILPFTEKYPADDISSLLDDLKFLEEYHLKDSVNFL